jgi:hypothetical protein
MRLNEVLQSELKYPVSIEWMVGSTWMNLASGYWQDGEFHKNPNVPFRLHDLKRDSEPELKDISDEIKKHPLPTDWREPLVLYPVIDGIQYSVIVSVPTVDGIEFGKQVEIK